MMFFNLGAAISVFFSTENAAAVNLFSQIFPSNNEDSIRSLSVENRNSRLLQATEDFLPLICNTEESWDCVPWPYGESAEAIEVGCNVCYSMANYNSTTDTTIVLSGPLNIKGKLDFPDGTKVTLRTTGIFVQGELSMTSTKVVDGIPDIILQFTGTENVFFTPDEPNTDACAGSPCNLGPKPFVVAGGKVNIDGMPDDCPTWTTVKDLIDGGKPKPLSYPKVPDLPITSKGTCLQTLINEDFEDSLNGWYGNAGAEEHISEHEVDGSFLRVTERKNEYQGPMCDLSALQRECLLLDQDYFFSARVRISPKLQYAPSQCHSQGTSCPKLQFSHMDSKNTVRWRELVSTDNTGIEDNLWFEIHQPFKIESSYVPADSSDVYSLFSINGVEAGIDIYVDDISITLPPSQAFPDPENVCDNLVINGNAELFNHFTYPFRPYIKQSTIKIKEEDGNSYFSITNRTKKFDSIAIDLNPSCLQTASIYEFSAKIRLHSLTADSPLIKLISQISGQNDFSFNVINPACPQTSSAAGWVTCQFNFTANEYFSTTSSLQLLIVFPGNENDDADFDDISIIFQSSVQKGGIELMDNGRMNSCYAPGAKILLPSDDLNFHSEQIVTLQDSQHNFAVVIEELERISTFVDNPDFATEFAFLSRNILFENGDPDDVGPSFVVLQTPGTKQKVKGVDFNGFGQNSNSERHPIYFKLSDKTTSIVSKNTIRNSNNRCINIKGTHNVLVAENIAYNTLGHCFVLASGTGNVFDRNLGAVTTNSTLDTECSTFYIGHPSNTFTGNVAAGSKRNGFWILPSSNDMVSFSGNIAHSNSLFGIKSLFKPLTMNTWTNTKVYRNLSHGILLRLSRNIHLDGGVIADNRIGIDIWSADGIKISGMKVMGSSASFRRVADMVPGTETQCPAVTASPIYGVRLFPNAMTEGSVGTEIVNVAFSDFDDSTECNSVSTAISFNTIGANPVSFTTSVQVSGSAFDVFANPKDKISLCDAFTDNLLDIYIIDDGSLNPYDNGPGLVVSNDVSMTQSGSCSTMVGSCAQYCVGADMTLIMGVSPTKAPSKAAGQDNSPGSSPAEESGPSSDATSICIQNGDMENGMSGWKKMHSVNMETVQGVGNSGTALKVSGRSHQARSGPAQEILTACLSDNGEWFKVTADVKITNLVTNTEFICDPTVMYYNGQTCAGINLLVGNDVQQVGFTTAPLRNNDGWNKIYGVFKLTSDITSHSTIDLIVSRATKQVDITVDNLVLSLAEQNAIGVTNCNNPLANGDAEIGDARSWWIRGHGNNGYIEMGSPGYAGSNYAFKHMGDHSHRLSSMVQIMDNSCFPEGSSWTITAQFRVFDSDLRFIECDKSKMTVSNSCPAFSFFAGGTGVQVGPLKNNDDSPIIAGYWNRIESSFTVTPEMASYLDMWININAPTDFNYEIDDMLLVRS